MNTPSDLNGPCPHPEQWERYRRGVCTPESLGALKAHLAQCNACAAQVAELTEEAAFLQSALAPEHSVAETLDDLQRALYLDGALDARARMAAEQVFSASQAERHKLIQLYRETQVACDPNTRIETVERHVDGEVLAFEERSGGGGVNEEAMKIDTPQRDEEERKQRYLSEGG